MLHDTIKAPYRIRQPRILECVMDPMLAGPFIDDVWTNLSRLDPSAIHPETYGPINQNPKPVLGASTDLGSACVTIEDKDSLSSPLGVEETESSVDGYRALSLQGKSVLFPINYAQILS